MSHIRILVCRVDDEAPDHLNELAAFDMPESDPAALAAGTALDPLETATNETGQAMLRAALQAQWAVVDAQCVAMYCRQVPPGQLRRDRHRPITVASRLGTLQLRRQMLAHRDSGVRVRPGDQALPIRRGMVISRSLQEWACLLTQDVSFATAAQLLGWKTQEERILSPTLCTLVRRHRALVRIAEREAIGAYPYQAGGSLAPVPLVPYSTPKRRAGWPAVLSNAVEAALARENTCPPRSIAWADWARVIEARRSDPARSETDLRHLVPDVAEHQLLITIDEVLARADSAGVYRAAHRAYSHMGRLSLRERSGRRLPAAGARMDRALP